MAGKGAGLGMNSSRVTAFGGAAYTEEQVHNQPADKTTEIYKKL